MVLEDELSAIAPEDRDRWLEALSEDQQAEVAETLGAAKVDSMKAALVWTAGFVMLSILIATFLPGATATRDRRERGVPKAALK